MPKFTTYMPNMGEEEIKIVVEYTHHKSVRPSFGYAGGDPGEPEHCEIESIRYADTNKPVDDIDSYRLYVLENQAMDDYFGKFEER